MWMKLLPKVNLGLILTSHQSLGLFAKMAAQLHNFQNRSSMSGNVLVNCQMNLAFSKMVCNLATLSKVASAIGEAP